MGGLIGGIATAGMGIWQANDQQNAAQQQWSNTDRHLAYDERIAALKGSVDAGRVRMAGSQLADKQNTAFANSGVDASTGTAADVQASTQALSELDAQTKANDAAREVWGYELQRKQAGQNLQTQLGSINRQAVGSVLSGAVQAMGGGMSIGGSGGGGSSSGTGAADTPSQNAGDAAWTG